MQAPGISEERLRVIDNIRSALERGDTFSKVELHDPIVTPDDVKRVILPFDNLRTRRINRIKAFLARKIGEHLTRKINVNTVIVGLENALGIEGGAILTCNHFNIVDNTVVRVLAGKCGKAKSFDIVIQQTNVFMRGFFGFLMRNGYTLPVSDSIRYMARNFKPAVSELLSRGDFILIYPEQEMWFNYKKPRSLREGAYQLACENDVPIIPLFVEMCECEGFDRDGMRNVKHVLHVMPPIYPDHTLSQREAREKMREADADLKRKCYEEVYGIRLDDVFIPERDIAGYYN